MNSSLLLNADSLAFSDKLIPNEILIPTNKTTTKANNSTKSFVQNFKLILFIYFLICAPLTKLKSLITIITFHY